MNKNEKKQTMIIRLIGALTFTMVLAGCSLLSGLDDVDTSSRDEYKRSEQLPALEVPPDLTIENINDDFSIPGESRPKRLSEFEQQRRNSATATLATAQPAQTSDEYWISVKKSAPEIWHLLATYWQHKGYTLELADLELLVMETDWHTQQIQGQTVRDKFKLFIEPDNSRPEHQLVIIYNQRDQQSIDVAGETQWLADETDTTFVSAIRDELSAHLGVVDNKIDLNSNHIASAQKVQSLSDAQGRAYLIIQDGFQTAWDKVGKILQNTGYQISSANISSGLYKIMYFDHAEDKKGLWSKLKFWEKDNEPREYQVSLSGDGETKTELVVLNAEGQWTDGADAKTILVAIKKFYR